MVLSPVISAQFERQLSVLMETRQLVRHLITEYRNQLVYLDPSIGNVYDVVYHLVQDGVACLQTMNDLIWDLWSLYAEFDRMATRTHRKWWVAMTFICEFQ